MANGYGPGPSSLSKSTTARDLARQRSIDRRNDAGSGNDGGFDDYGPQEGSQDEESPRRASFMEMDQDEEEDEQQNILGDDEAEEEEEADEMPVVPPPPSSKKAKGKVRAVSIEDEEGMEDDIARGMDDVELALSDEGQHPEENEEEEEQHPRKKRKAKPVDVEPKQPIVRKSRSNSTFCLLVPLADGVEW